MVGMTESYFDTKSRQINFIATHMEDSANTLVFGTTDVSTAADEGRLIDYLKEKGAVTVEDGVLA